MKLEINFLYWGYKIYIPSIFFLSLLTGLAQAQHSFHLNGYLRDATTGESVIGAQVMDSLSGAGAITNAYGYFALSLAQPHAVLRVQMAGYQSIRLAMQLRGDTTLAIELPPFQTETVVIEDDAALTPSQAQVVSVPVRQLTKIPMPGGEPDVLKGLILLPGVSGGTEGSTGLYVRGGTPDQNLILLDGAPVYNVSHLFSFVSVFNGDAVKDIQLYKGGFPARYGGRLASVINITTKEGNRREHHQSVGVSPVAGRALFEGPLGQGSYMVAARASMAGLAMLPIYLRYIQGKSVEYQNYWLYDLNAK